MDMNGKKAEQSCDNNERCIIEEALSNHLETGGVELNAGTRARRRTSREIRNMRSIGERNAVVECASDDFEHNFHINSSDSSCRMNRVMSVPAISSMHPNLTRPVKGCDGVNLTSKDALAARERTRKALIDVCQEWEGVQKSLKISQSEPNLGARAVLDSLFAGTRNFVATDANLYTVNSCDVETSVDESKEQLSIQSPCSSDSDSSEYLFLEDEEDTSEDHRVAANGWLPFDHATRHRRRSVTSETNSTETEESPSRETILAEPMATTKDTHREYEKVDEINCGEEKSSENETGIRRAASAIQFRNWKFLTAGQRITTETKTPARKEWILPSKVDRISAAIQQQDNEMTNDNTNPIRRVASAVQLSGRSFSKAVRRLSDVSNS